MKIAVLAVICSHTANGQQKYLFSDSIPSLRIISINPRLFYRNDSTWIYSGICKTLNRYVLPSTNSNLSYKERINKTAFLKIHGNIQYDFLYRSYTDTPFYQQDFRQHTVKSNYHFLFRNYFPVQVTLMHRNTNSPYFGDISDVSVRYSHNEFNNNLKESIFRQLRHNIKVNEIVRLTELEKKYKQKLDEVEGLQLWISSPARLQEIVAERERDIRNLAGYKTDSLQTELHLQLSDKELPGLPDKNTVRKAISDKILRKINKDSDTILSRLERIVLEKKKKVTDSLQKTETKAYIDEKIKQLEKLKKELVTLKNQLKDIEKGLSDSVAKIKKEVMALKDAGAIKNYIQRKKLDTKELPGGWEPLAAIRSIGIGRSWVDYSELTVKNISLTGVNIEANPGSLYLAAAAGRINYRFRDFVSRSSAQPRQSLYLLRAGLGKKDGNNFILTWYDGKRSLLNPFADTLSSNLNLERVIGLSAETRLKLNENQFIVAEFAKSSFHSAGPALPSTPSLFDKVRNFSDRSNEAFSIRFNSHWPRAGATLTGYYKKMGEHFQSFNLQPVNTVQEAYQVKWRQSFWNKKFTVDAAIRKNDFSNPFISPGINSSMVFKSIQLSLKVPKYPFLSVGYAPSTQLTLLDSRRLAEHQYNTLNALLTHSYRFKKTSMVTNAMFLKFYNQSSDTGFIYFNASSFSLNQLIYTGPWQIQTGLTIVNQEELKVLTLEQETTLKIKNWLTLSAGMKYNRVVGKETLWGGSAGMNMSINKIGIVSLNFDKAYLPGTSRNLLPVYTGSLGYFRAF